MCAQLAGVAELSAGFNAVGFSQGGQFLRAYVQRCNRPPVRNLITLGSQHQGIMGLPGCQNDRSLADEERHAADLELGQAYFPEEASSAPSKTECSWWQRLIKRGVYTELAQSRIVQAQYFKDPHKMDEYLSASTFLADINNERQVKNDTYIQNLASLQNFVMFMFEQDEQVVPRESSVGPSQRTRVTPSGLDSTMGRSCWP